MTDTIETTATAPKHVNAQFSDPSKRLAMIALDYPVRVDGVDYSSIGIKRLTVKEVSEFLASLKQKGEDAAISRWPMYVDAEGHLVSDDVLDALDDDDLLKLDKMVTDFLPQRFRVTQNTDSRQPNGATIER